MNFLPFDRDTRLDLLVNVIPLVILFIFLLLFLVTNPFGGTGSLGLYIQVAIVGLSIVLLAILSYFAAAAIYGDEQAQEME